MCVPTTIAKRVPISSELRESIYDASVDYHEKLRTYECIYSESTETETNDFLQRSERRIIEDALGQIRLESSTSQVDDQGNVGATLNSVQVYDLRAEMRAHSQPDSPRAHMRLITISPTVTITTMIRPISYVMADGQPMHELLDSLTSRKIQVYSEAVQIDDLPDRLVELSFTEPLDSGDVLRHTFVLDRGNNYMPLRQVLYFNKKRYRVLEPTLQEVSPGIHFPVKAVKFSYDKDSEENELRSITRMSVESIRINTEIPDGTFKLEVGPNDTVTDLRGNRSDAAHPTTDVNPVG